MPAGTGLSNCPECRPTLPAYRLANLNTVTNKTNKDGQRSRHGAAKVGPRPKGSRLRARCSGLLVGWPLRLRYSNLSPSAKAAAGAKASVRSRTSAIRPSEHQKTHKTQAQDRCLAAVQRLLVYRFLLRL